MEDFKSLKYETRTKEEHNQIKEALVAKMENWKYFPKELTKQVPNVLLKEVAP